ncbi:MAG: bile acidNa+ symporter BASS [Beijerinckiaceae bacterium]|nr:MAG: bile acidNa+ symporter BASS [Beijerinckiaceae bacterium]
MLNPLRSALAYVGRHAAAAYALSIFLGLALPQIAAVLRPVIPISIFTFIVLSFARANLPGLRAVVARPVRLGYGLAISTLIPPLVAWVILATPLAAGLDPGIRLGIALMAAAPPLMASPAFASVLGLENSLALTLLVLGMVLAPVASPALASALAGAEVPISPFALAQRLAIFIGGGMLVGLAVRKVLGMARIAALKNEFDGMGVVLFFLFAIAAMDGVIDAALSTPVLVISILLASSAFSAVCFALAYGLARAFGFNDRFTTAICIGLRNMGLLMAPIFSVVPQTTFLYFALAQVPIYIAPIILKAVKARLEPP